MKRAARVDKNQPLIVALLRAFGCAVIHTHQLKNFCDVIAYRGGQTYTIEIKQTSKDKLTTGEEEAKELIESVGCEYHIVYSARCLYKLLNVTTKQLAEAMVYVSKNIEKKLRTQILLLLDASLIHCRERQIQPYEI